jgi:cell division protein FtsB
VKLTIVTLLVLLIFLQYQLWAGDGGLRDRRELAGVNAEQLAENQRLAERNKSLAAEVKDLKEGLQAVEERARSDMGMIKQGEVFYQIVDRQHGVPAEQR